CFGLMHLKSRRSGSRVCAAAVMLRSRPKQRTKVQNFLTDIGEVAPVPSEEAIPRICANRCCERRTEMFILRGSSRNIHSRQCCDPLQSSTAIRLSQESRSWIAQLGWRAILQFAHCAMEIEFRRSR